MVRRINFYGGPGCGKSTVSSRLYGELRSRGHNVEFVPEYIKTWAYAGKKPKLFDQVYIFGKQLYAESQMLEHVDFVVCEAPLLMCAAYAMKHQAPCWREQVSMAMEFERHYSALHIVLDRVGIPYVQHGRYEDYAQAMVMDQAMELMLRQTGLSWTGIRATEFAAVVSLVSSAVAIQSRLDPSNGNGSDPGGEVCRTLQRRTT